MFQTAPCFESLSVIELYSYCGAPAIVIAQAGHDVRTLLHHTIESMLTYFVSITIDKLYRGHELIGCPMTYVCIFF